MTRQFWTALAGLPLLLATAEVGAAPPAKDRSWPCVQQFVPQITAGSIWNGPSLPAEADWQTDPAVVALVGAISPRSVSAEAGAAKIAAFAQSVRPERRPTDLPAAFVGLVVATNQQRAELIGRIKDLAKRQHEMADLVASVTEELKSVPEGATGADADRRDEIVQRRAYVIREFEEAQRTMRYACEVPVQLEARLGSYAHALQSTLPQN